MFAGVTYNYFVINAILAAELFLVFRSVWVLPVALVVHGIGVLLDVPPSGPSIIMRAQGVDSRSASPAGAAVRRS